MKKCLEVVSSQIRMLKIPEQLLQPAEHTRRRLIVMMIPLMVMVVIVMSSNILPVVPVERRIVPVDQQQQAKQESGYDSFFDHPCKIRKKCGLVGLLQGEVCPVAVLSIEPKPFRVVIISIIIESYEK